MHLDRKLPSLCIPGLECWGNESLWLRRPYCLNTRREIFLFWWTIVGFIYLDFIYLIFFLLNFLLGEDFIHKYFISIICILGLKGPCLRLQAVDCIWGTLCLLLPALNAWHSLDWKKLQSIRKCPSVMPGVTSCLFLINLSHGWNHRPENFPLLQSVPRA